MARVTGLGGVFYVVKDPAATQRWYEEMLGLTGDYGPQIPWSDEPHAAPYSLISHFADDKYIEPGKGGFMINLRVDDCDAMVEQLKAKGVEIFGQVDEGYGKFAWLLDPDGVKIELWEQGDTPDS
jgi:catechol 2,3-dioxygenase-like lactoylglutathione lyase family enzyme|tara:strand:+ start:893 stop:1267 length:375 start_codon:yes stop_codon:yes gene_type:complete